MLFKTLHNTVAPQTATFFLSIFTWCKARLYAAQVSQRFYNSHALLNMAVYLPAVDGNVIDGVRVAVGHWDTTDMGDRLTQPLL